MSNIKPITKTEEYLNFLNFGGAVEDLPIPLTKVEEYLYLLCIKGMQGGSGGSGESSTVNIIDNLLSTSTTDVLSANQGRILNQKIPAKCITGLSEDTWNNGIGISWSDGDYSRMFVNNIPTIANTLRRLDIEENGVISIYTTNAGNKTVIPPYTTDINLEQETGILRITKANNTISKEIDLKSYIQSIIAETQGISLVDSNQGNYTQYYKIVDNNKILITKEEFDELQYLNKYYKELEGELIEITEEEFIRGKEPK